MDSQKFIDVCESDPKSKKFWSPILAPDWSFKEENALWDTKIVGNEAKVNLKTSLGRKFHKS